MTNHDETSPPTTRGIAIDPRVAWQINEMAAADQEMRQHSEDDPDFWDYGMAGRHAKQLGEILDKYGWPSIPKVGETASFNAWLIAQHADRSKDLQKRCLDLMRRELPEDIDRTRVAFLEDRVLVNARQPQIYGTQFKDDAHGYGPRPIADPDNVDARRKEAGLKELEEYALRLSRKYRINLRKNWDPRTPKRKQVRG